MDSVMGQIKLNGDSLEVIKLDTHDGIVSIRGNVSSLIYNDVKRKDQESLFTKLFK